MPEHCPIPNELHAYTLGNLPRERCEEIDVHLVDCQPCQAELETFTGGDSTFLAHLKDSDSSDEFLEEAECASVLARVAEFGQEASFNTQHQHAEQNAATAQLGNIGPYQLLAKLGEGGMGTVYKALHPMLKRVVALKMLPVDRMQDEQAIQRFQREMEAVGKLDHPNIVRATDAGDHDGKHFLVMEYVDGIDLSALSKRVGPLPIADACELIRQAAIGLQHAHENGLVHRDIKPSNLMLMDGARVGGRGASAISSPRDPQSSALVKILDLGLALLPDQLGEESELTSTGQAMGTLDYMSPEQGGDSHDVDIRADIYALGATLYRLLTGQPIYSGPKYKTVMDKWRALATEDPAPLQSRRPEVPDALAAVVHRMLAREVAVRYATPQEVAQALAPFCEAANLPALVEAQRPPVDDEVSQSTTSLLKEAGSLDTSLRPQDSADLARTQSLVAAGSPGSVQAKPQAANRRKDSNRSLLARGVGLLGILALAAALVFYFQTPHGTLRVEINDPEIEVQVKGSDITLSNADKKPIKLKAGEHSLIVTRGDDFTFETKQLILKKGETTTVKVELLPGKVQVISGDAILGERQLDGGPTFASGTASYALQFDGNSSYVDISSLKYKGDHPITLEAIVEPRNDSSGAVVSNWIHRRIPTAGCALGQGDTESVWFFGTRRENKLSGVIAPAERSRLVHVAGIWEGNKLRIFVDGRPFSEQLDHEGEAIEDVAHFIIGAERQPSGRTNFFDGVIHELRISSVARYEDAFEPLAPHQKLSTDDHTLALYHFDEGSGDVLHDSSGNNHHGKIVRAKWVRCDGELPPVNFALDFSKKERYRETVTIPLDGMTRKAPLTIEAFLYLKPEFEPTNINSVVWQFAQEPSLNLWQTSGENNKYWTHLARRIKEGRVHQSAFVPVSPGPNHVAIVWREDGTTTFYYNGRPHAIDGSSFQNVTAKDASNELLLGTIEKSHPGILDGQLDELRISNVARYDKRFTPPSSKSRFTPDEHTLALYHFDEGSGDVLRDSSGNNHHGKIVGAKWVRVDGGEIAPETAKATDATIASTGEPILAEPVQYDATEALNRHGLVPYPAPLAGVKSWSLDTTVSRGAPRHLAFSPDGEYLAYFADGALRIVGGETYEPVRTIMRPRMREIAWLADSQTISLAEQHEDDTSTVRLWNVRDGHLVRRIDFPFSVGTAISVHHTHPSMAWSGDDRLAIRDADGKVVIYDLATEKVVGELPHLWRIGGVAWSPDDKRLAVTSIDRESPVACIWDTSKFEMLHKLDARDADATNVDNQPYGMVWSSDSKQLIVGYRLAGVIAWDAETGERKASPSIAFPSTVWKLQRGGQTDEIVVAGGGIETWNLRTGEVRQLHDADGIGAVVSHPRSERILWTSEFSRGIYSAISLDGSGYTTSDFSLPRRKRRIPPIRPMFLTENLTRPVSRLGESQYSSRLWDGGQAVAATANVAVRMSGSGFEIKRDGRIVWRYIPDDPAEANPWAQFALASDGGTVAQFNRRQLKAWKMPDGELLADMPAPDLTHSNERLFVSADRRFILVDPGGQIAVSGPDFGGDFSVHSIHSGNSVDMSPNGTQLAFYGRLGVTLFDIKSQKMSKPLKAPSSFDYGHCDTVAWRNEKTLALYTIDKQVALFDIPTAKVVRSYPFPWAQRPFFCTYSSFFGAAGQYFIAARWGEDARFVDTTNGWVESIVRYEGGEYLHVGATGHYDASVNIEPNLIYVVELPDGSQLNLTPAEFEKRFGWKNDASHCSYQGKFVATKPVRIDTPAIQGTESRLTPSPPSGLSDDNETSTGPLSAASLVRAPVKLPGINSWTLETDGERDVIRAIIFVPDGKRFATLDEHGVIRLRSADDGELLNVFVGDRDGEHLLYLKDDEVLLAVSDDGDVHRWRLSDGRHSVRLWQGEMEIAGAKCSPDGQQLVAWLDEGSAAVFNAQTGDQVVALKVDARRGSEFSWSPDGKQIASGFGIWDAATGEQLQSLDVQGPADRHPRYATWSPDGKQLVTWAGETYLWDTATGELLGNPGGSTTRLVRFSPDGRYLATGGGFVTSVRDMKHDRHLSAHRGEHHVSAIAWSPDSKHILIGDDEGDLTLWSRETFKDVFAHVGDTETINAVKISPSGHYSASEDASSRLVYVAETDDGRQLTLTPAEIEEAYSWKNDPIQLELE